MPTEGWQRRMENPGIGKLTKSQGPARDPVIAWSARNAKGREVTVRPWHPRFHWFDENIGWGLKNDKYSLEEVDEKWWQPLNPARNYWPSLHQIRHAQPPIPIRNTQDGHRELDKDASNRLWLGVGPPSWRAVWWETIKYGSEGRVTNPLTLLCFNSRYFWKRNV